MVCDDLSFGGKDDAKHGGIPKQVLDRARANNVKFNLSKLQFRVLEVKYVGQAMSSEAFKTRHDKVKAITEYASVRPRKIVAIFLDLLTALVSLSPTYQQ